MTEAHYLQLRDITFSGPKGKRASISFTSGVNVICGASETGKSFLSESVDFMLGGKELRPVPELAGYSDLSLQVTDGETVWILQRAISGGDFSVRKLDDDPSEFELLKQTHSHGKSDNLSGFLLEKLDLLNKRILKSAKKSTTQSLSFRNLARLAIVQEGEIQQLGSPFWTGQFTTKTSELATTKLLLTGIDDSSVVTATAVVPGDDTRQIALIDEWLLDIESEIVDVGADEEELKDQLAKLTDSLESQRRELTAFQIQLDAKLSERREILESRQAIEYRMNEIQELLGRFELLGKHYSVDITRLRSIHESGTMLVHIEQKNCPLCGASASEEHRSDDCDGNVDEIIAAAGAEISKIETLSTELVGAVNGLTKEDAQLSTDLRTLIASYNLVDAEIRESVSPTVGDARASYSLLVDTRAKVQEGLALFERKRKLEERKATLVDGDDEPSEKQEVVSGIPDTVAHHLSLKVGSVLKAWTFPGECVVHYDKATSDFVIDGKPRGSRGKGLRAISHAAVSVALLEFCQENELPHPGFIVLDSPLLAYYEPEGDEDHALQGTDLKERFYEYLVKHHQAESQVIVVENQHPPQSVLEKISMTVFTRNPNEGRFGLL